MKKKNRHVVGLVSLGMSVLMVVSGLPMKMHLVFLAYNLLSHSFFFFFFFFLSSLFNSFGCLCIPFIYATLSALLTLERWWNGRLSSIHRK